MKNAPIAILIFFLSSGNISFPAENQFNNYIKDYSSVKSIRGNLVQYIINDASFEKISGYYSAINEGWFRIDYILPEKQIVIFNGKGLYWFYPERNLLYIKYKKPDEQTSLPGTAFIQNFENVNVFYQGVRFYGLLKYAHVYSFKNVAGDRTVVVWFNPEKRYVVRKYIIDNSGREIVKEIYHEHCNTGSVYIPSKIELFIRSESGIIHTQTEYSDLQVNFSTDKRNYDFKIEKKMTVRYLDEN